MRVIRAVSFIALAAALHAGVSSLGLSLVPDVYPTPEMTARVQHYVFIEAVIAFAAMLGCYMILKRASAGCDPDARS